MKVVSERSNPDNETSKPNYERSNSENEDQIQKKSKSKKNTKSVLKSVRTPFPFFLNE